MNELTYSFSQTKVKEYSKMVVAFQASVDCNRIPLGSVGWELKSFNGWGSKTIFEPITRHFSVCNFQQWKPNCSTGIGSTHLPCGLFHYWVYMYMTCVLVVTASCRSLDIKVWTALPCYCWMDDTDWFTHDGFCCLPQTHCWWNTVPLSVIITMGRPNWGSIDH